MQELPNPDAESQDSVNCNCYTPQEHERLGHDEPRFRTCGCPMDYHLSDCPIVTPVTELDFELWPFSEPWRQDD